MRVLQSYPTSMILKIRDTVMLLLVPDGAVRVSTLESLLEDPVCDTTGVSTYTQVLIK